MASVGSSVGMRVESDGPRSAEGCGLRIRMLGPLEIRRAGAALALPSSRKVRALLAYLALAPREVSRTQICDLLWDVPNDPRGELRWCLSKIRRLVDDEGRQRVLAREDAIRLDLTDCFVDAVELRRAMEGGAATLGAGEAEALTRLFGGDLLEGLEMDRSPAFAAWLAAQRRRFRGVHVALLERLATRAPDEESFGHLETWLELAPFDHRAHGLLLGALARCNRLREGEEHVESAARRFEEEGLDFAPIRRAWQSARRQGAGRALASTAGPAPEVAVPGDAPGHVDAPAHRASVAVMPFQDGTGVAGRRGWADALAHDVITRLAKLRCLFVIAEGTVFALKERQLPPEAAGRMLNVDYVVAGALRAHGDRLSVEVQLDETRTARVVWSETFDQRAGRPLRGDRRNRQPDRRLDRQRDRGQRAQPRHPEAAELARCVGGAPPRPVAHVPLHPRGQRGGAAASSSGPSRSTRPSRAPTPGFLHPLAERLPGLGGRATRRSASALEAARRGLLADDRDPAGALGPGARALASRTARPVGPELAQAVDLSPNFAQGHYTLAFVQAQAGDPHAAIAAPTNRAA